jgi:hypothetical protein
MRYLLTALALSMITLFPSASNAGDRLREIRVNHNTETYHGYYIDLSDIAGRQNFDTMADALRHQLDLVESIGLSPSVLNFFHAVPIVAGDEIACLIRSPDVPPTTPPSIACFTPGAHMERRQRPVRVFTVLDNNSEWANPDPIDLAEDTRHGFVMTRPIVLDAQRPVMLHELLHAYHYNRIPQGFQNPDILLYYNLAKGETLYPPGEYLLTNEKEFFAVTASVFLYGKDAELTRSDLKQKLPDYFKYLVRLFEFDPDGAPVASQTPPTPTQTVQTR